MFQAEVKASAKAQGWEAASGEVGDREVGRKLFIPFPGVCHDLT